MRIVQFLHGNALGGMEKFCLDLSNTLAKEHEVLLIADPVFQKYVEEGVEFVPLDVEKSRNNLWFLWKLYKIMSAFSPDIVQIHKQISIDIMKRLSPFLKVPFIVTKQDMQKKKAFYGLEYAVSISEETATTVQAKHLYKIYNGIPYREPKKIKMPPGFNIVAVGGLRAVKGYDDLLVAVSKLSFPYHLTILGEGTERKYLESEIERLGLEKQVTLAGFTDAINDYLYSADLQVISSHSEGFSLAMVEGIFYTPVLVSTKVSGCTEILSEELLMDREEITARIEDVYHNYERYKEAFAKIKQRYKDELTMEQCAKNYLRVYKEVIWDYRQKRR